MLSIMSTCRTRSCLGEGEVAGRGQSSFTGCNICEISRWTLEVWISIAFRPCQWRGEIISGGCNPGAYYLHINVKVKSEYQNRHEPDENDRWKEKPCAAYWVHVNVDISSWNWAIHSDIRCLKLEVSVVRAKAIRSCSALTEAYLLSKLGFR